jgi:hypothetical protein
LVAKSCWRGLFGKGLWNLILNKKYLKDLYLISWLHREERKFPVASIILKNFMFSFPIFKRWLAWSIGCGNRVILGYVPFIGCNSSYKLSGPLIQHLNRLNIFSLAQAAFPNDSRTNDSLYEANQLRLT